MKTVLKIFGGIALLVVVLVGAGVGWLALRKPAQRPPSTERIEVTQARLDRGEYLVRHVADCLNCHSDHMTSFGVPIKPGTEGMGGFVFDQKLGFPGVVAAQNLTPDPATGIGNWTDGEILRAFREGVDRQGNALFPMMPYQHLRVMSDEDAKSVVVYLRTLKPIRNQVPLKHIDFPINLFVKFAPQPLTGPVSSPDPHDSVKYGEYLSRIGGCYECHTPHDDKNQLIADKAFSGGWRMEGPWGLNYTANITPHPETFLGRATKEEFISRFRAFQGLDASSSPAAPNGQNTIMPWLTFSGMTDHDLGALYDYLKTQKPIENKVNPFPNKT